MTKIHLLCNAHLDPVWLWTRDEGMAEAISTFRVAAQFCEDYDGFVFNHNESVLYEWVEENEPELFERIKELVKQGKWRIMGGWYLQPDCTMPSGEAFIKQIEVGTQYFYDKFGVKPRTAINVDPFGHTRGLVQILKKCGYDSYLFMRPYNFVKGSDFIWKGYDGSEVIGHCMRGGYNSLKGDAVNKLKNAIEGAHEGANLMLWGVGNHGGGPSRIDLEGLNAYIEEHPEVEIEHSWCEKYFDEVDRSKLPTVEGSIVHCMVGCYTSMVQIKQNYRRLENELITCEKMLAVSGVDYDKKLLEEANKALLFSQFHDILPGSMIKAGETETLRLLGYGQEIAYRLKTKAFFALCKGQKAAKSGEIPIIVFNPHPYKVTREIEVEFQLEDQNWTDNEVTLTKVRDEKGNYLPTQNEKEASSLHLDWRKRIVFRAELEPMSINRFDCELEVTAGRKRPILPCEEDENYFIFRSKALNMLISKKTGLIDKYEVQGVDYLKEGSAEIAVYKDNEDPWGMTVDGYYDKIGSFELVSAEEANAFWGYPDTTYENVRVIENGSVRCKIQALFKHENSYAAVTYIIPKDGTDVDIAIKVFSNDVNRMYKLSFDTPFEEFVGQTAFGREKLLKQEREVTYQKWCGMFDGEKGLAVLNQGTYGGSAKDGRIHITLLRTPVYSGHPINDRPICDDDRMHDHIDMGEREFTYRLTTDIEKLDQVAEVYNQPPYALSFFPSGAGEKLQTRVEVSNSKVIMTSYKKTEEGKYLARLFNSSSEAETTTLEIRGKMYTYEFSPYEVKGFLIEETGLQECSLLGR